METKQTVKKRNNRRAVEEQVEVTPRWCRTTPTLLSVSALRTRVGMSPLCQEQSLVSGKNLIFSLLLAYETRVWGARAQKETPEDPSPRTSAPSRGWARSWFTYSFYLGSPSPHKEYNISIEVIGGQSSRVMYIRFRWLLYHIVESILVDVDRSLQQPDNACED